MAREKMEETLGGAVLHSVPFPTTLDAAALARLPEMAPILLEQTYAITYLHSYGQDSPFFAGLASGRLLVTRDPESGYTYATPRGHDMVTGNQTEWVEIEVSGAVHAFTVCHFGSEAFLPETVHPGAGRVSRRRYPLPHPAHWPGPGGGRAELDWHARARPLPPPQ